jgi:hypothetical protein
MMTDFSSIRRALANLPSDHDAAGEHRPSVDEIFTPEQHANALDPYTPVVVGARGTGKSFWAGVLEQEDTRAVAALAYPNLGLDRLLVRAGYTGFSSAEGAVTPKIIDARVPPGKEKETASDFWLAIIFRVAKSALNPEQEMDTIREIMQQDPEDLAKEFKALDERIAATKKTLLVTFDALDTLSRDWNRSSLLMDGLFEAIWSLRARRAIKAKIFIRPEQLNDETLRFVELPKLRSGRVELDWTQLDLYGLLFSRLATSTEAKKAFAALAESIDAPVPANFSKNRQHWPLITSREKQKAMMEKLAGPYMGSSAKQGGTYDWPYKHLSDTKGKVTPRSFIKLFVVAANFKPEASGQMMTPEGIRAGLREASKVRVDQLGIEYQWIKRALIPLAGLTVPCTLDAVSERWNETNTISLILDTAANPDTGFLPPFPPSTKKNQAQLLAEAMERIGVLSYRADNRIDIPDLFRVAAKMLKKGGTTPIKR